MEKGTNTRKKLLSDAFKLFSSNSYENGLNGQMYS